MELKFEVNRYFSDRLIFASDERNDPMTPVTILVNLGFAIGLALGAAALLLI